MHLYDFFIMKLQFSLHRLTLHYKPNILLFFAFEFSQKKNRSVLSVDQFTLLIPRPCVISIPVYIYKYQALLQFNQMSSKIESVIS